MEKRLYVWGSGGTGQLGVGTTDDYAFPQLWSNDLQLEPQSVTSGGCHTAGISLDGRLYLWGSDEKGQLGRVESEQAQTHVSRPSQPVSCCGGNKTKLVACGWWNTLVVADPEFNDQGDQVFSWGSNDHYQLGRKPNGDGDEAPNTMILDLPPKISVVSIACGWKHSLLATSDGGIFAWGSGRHGQLGLGSDVLKTDKPLHVEKLDGKAVTNVFCGWEHSVFQSAHGDVFTCGNNRHGQLGVSTTNAETSEGPRERRKQVNGSPLRVCYPLDDKTGLRAAQIGCGWHYVLCLSESGALVSWGKGSHGQLGRGDFENASEPKQVEFPHPIQQIACGSEHSMVLTNTGDLYTCGWGEHGNLGHGDNTNRASLERVNFFSSTNQTVVKIGAGGAVSLAVTCDRLSS